MLDDVEPARAPHPVRRAAPAAPSDPIFDRPYEEPAATPAETTAAPAPAPASGLSRFIKPKRKVAALLGGKRSG